ncbi:MAG: hypothetical protein RL367_2455 [Pseudomonadota bacterium]
MRGAFLLIGLALVSGCKKAPDASGPPAAGPHGPMPVYVTRGDAPAGDRLVAGRDGEQLFRNHCGMCHLAGGMGTNVLTVQMIAAKRPPTDGLLENRTDLQADYIKTVVRNGKIAMPRQTRVDVTDVELDSVAAYLAKVK